LVIFKNVENVTAISYIMKRRTQLVNVNSYKVIHWGVVATQHQLLECNRTVPVIIHKLRKSGGGKQRSEKGSAFLVKLEAL